MPAAAPPLSRGTLELLPVQYSDASGYITGEPDDAETATFFTLDGEVILTLKRSPRRLWMWEYSDFVPGRDVLWRKRWPNPAAALAHVAYLMGYAATLAVEA